MSLRKITSCPLPVSPPKKKYKQINKTSLLLCPSCHIRKNLIHFTDSEVSLINCSLCDLSHECCPSPKSHIIQADLLKCTFREARRPRAKQIPSFSSVPACLSPSPLPKNRAVLPVSLFWTHSNISDSNPLSFLFPSIIIWSWSRMTHILKYQISYWYNSFGYSSKI